MDHLIRAADIADHLLMEDLWLASVKAIHHFLTEQDVGAIKAQLPDIFKSINCYFSVNKARQIVGMLGLTSDQIAMLFVHPDAFGTGVGRKMMEFAIILHGH